MWGALAIAAAYLIGSFPTAYLVTKWRSGKDIRTLGSGNVGAHNVWENVGKTPSVIVGIIDVIKGILAVILAQAIILNGVSTGATITVLNLLLFTMGAALAAVIGHIWPVWLKFKGGNGIATTIGILLMLMTREVLIAIAVALLILAFTKNPILSINIGLLLTIPIAGALMHNPWWPYLSFALVLIAILVLNFVPTMRAAMNKAGSREQMTAELLRIEKDKKARKKKR